MVLGGEPEPPSTVTLSSPPAPRTSTVLHEAVTGVGSSGTPVGVGSTPFLSSPGFRSPPPRVAAVDAPTAHGTVQVSPSVHMDSTTGRLHVDVAHSTPKRGATGLPDLPSLPASVAKYLSPAAQKHVRVRLVCACVFVACTAN